MRISASGTSVLFALAVGAAFAGRLAPDVRLRATPERPSVAAGTRHSADAASAPRPVTARRQARVTPPAESDDAEPAPAGREELLGTVRGVVLDPSGASARGVPVCVFLSEEEQYTTTTDDAGTWCVPGLRFDSVVIDAEIAGVAKSGLQVVRLDAEHPDVAVDLRLRELAWLDLAVSAPDGVVPAECAARWSGAESCADESMVTLDASGCGTVELNDEGSGWLTVCVDPWPPWTAEVAVVRGRRMPVRVALERGVALDGLVVDDRGCAVAGAVVGVNRNDRVLGAETDALGAFRIAWLTAAAHDLSVTAEHHDEFRRSEFVPDGHAPLRIVLPREGRVALRLGVRNGSAPPVDVEICGERLEPRDGPYLNETLPWSEGTQSVAALPGRWHFVVARKGFARVDRETDVAPGETTDLGLVELDEGVTLSGIVSDLHGRAIAGAAVHVGWTRDTTADETGRFVLDHMPRREVELDVSAEGFFGTSAAANPFDGACVVTLRRGALVRGVVAECSVGTKLRLRCRALAAQVITVDPNTDGGFETRVAAGRWTAELVEDDRVLASRDLELAEGDVRDVEFGGSR